MKIEYAEPTMQARIDQAIAQARTEGRDIECIRLSAPELSRFCDEGGLAFDKNCTYTYKHYRIAYDWGSYR